MDISKLFNAAFQAAETGENTQAVELYHATLQCVEEQREEIASEDREQIVRSIYFNLAQSQNKLRRYHEALESVQQGLAHYPTSYGKAIALAAKGEALCGLQRNKDGGDAFEDAVGAHPIVGRLNSADSLVRLGTPQFVSLAEQWLDEVDKLFGSQLDKASRAEVNSIRSRIAAIREPAEPTSDSHKSRQGLGSDGSKSALGAAAISHAEEEGARMANKAMKLAQQAAQLQDAADLMEQAFNKSPDLRNRYARRVKLWRCGIVTPTQEQV